jgi:ABC-type uncharacterized transport system substrate-binding protein
MRPSAASGFYRYLTVILAKKPADLPVEQATKVEFVINLKAAKQIGLTLEKGRASRSSVKWTKTEENT